MERNRTPVHQDHLGHRDSLESPASMEKMDKPDRVVDTVTATLRSRATRNASRARKAKQDHQDQMDHLDQRDQMETQVLMLRPHRMAHPDSRDLPEIKARLDSLVQPASPDNPDRTVNADRANLDRLAHRDHPASLDKQDRTVPPEIRELTVSLDQLDLMETMGSQDRTAVLELTAVQVVQGRTRLTVPVLLGPAVTNHLPKLPLAAKVHSKEVTEGCSTRSRILLCCSYCRCNKLWPASI